VPTDPPYRDFLYPLNVFMHVLMHEEGGASYLHYGLFERPGESIAAAQARSTKLLVDKLPKPPASVLEVGIGLGTTLALLTRLGYDAHGITPDEKQVAMVRDRYGDTVRVEVVAFENFAPRRFDVVVFQESSQYIDAKALFAKCAVVTSHVVVLDEFAVGEGTLHRLDDFLDAAALNRFRKVEEIDLSSKAAPTIDYFMKRFERLRGMLVADIGITSEQVDELIASGNNYRRLYENGTYVYRLLRFTKE
jgi:SAM-dependent methyltransferase